MVNNIKLLRSITGEGMLDCRKALVWAKNDLVRAEGYLKYHNLAVYVKNREAWLDMMVDLFVKNKKT